MIKRFSSLLLSQTLILTLVASPAGGVPASVGLSKVHGPVRTEIPALSKDIIETDAFQLERELEAEFRELGGELVAQASGARKPSRKAGNSKLGAAIKLATSGRYEEASKALFELSRDPRYIRESAQIKYILGLMLYEMKMNQSAAFVFYEVIRQEGRNPSSKYLRQSLGKLALAANSLNSDVLLRYAVKQVKEEDFPSANIDMFHFRMGEIKMQEKQFAEAAREFVKVRPNSLFFQRARYNLALALAEAGDLDKARAAFLDLAERSRLGGVTDKHRVNALMGAARTLYQKKDFGRAIETYNEIPRDTLQWHDALFESTWAMLRDGRFRSALSNFHSLHSTYYEDFYQPESLYLRSIVYLYICRYDETEKVLDLFETVYKPIHQSVRTMLNTISEPMAYYREISKVQDRYDALKADRLGRSGFQIPFIVARHVLKESDVKRTMSYIDQLQQEKRRIESASPAWKGTGIGQYARKVVDRRLQATQVLAGKQIRKHVTDIHTELKDLFEQTGFLRFEMLSSKKEVVRKEIAGKGLDIQRIEASSDRSFYIQNGYEYWPFTGEYWLDEIGNYHYVGVKACD